MTSVKPAEEKRPRLWKQFVVTVAAVYLLTLLIPVVLEILSRYLPFVKVRTIRGMLTAVLLVSALMFALNPLFGRIFRGWFTR